MSYMKYDLIKCPLITEKTTRLGEIGKYVFAVAKEATKPLVKVAIEDIFGVKVTSVNILTRKGKTKRFKGRKGYRSGFKKAIVTLKDGDTIDFTGGN